MWLCEPREKQGAGGYKLIQNLHSAVPTNNMQMRTERFYFVLFGILSIYNNLLYKVGDQWLK